METIIALANIVSLAAQVAPVIEKVYADAKTVTNALFASAQITRSQQNDLNAWFAAHQAALETGTVPPEFTVEKA